MSTVTDSQSGALPSLLGGVSLNPVTVQMTATTTAAAMLPTAPTVDAIIPYQTFDRNVNFTVGDGDPVSSYRSRKNQVKKALNWGQFKLLMEELQFLTLYWDADRIPNPTVVYVGSAPGTHIGVLAQLFPSITFQLYDPRKHCTSCTDKKNIVVHEQLFDVKTAAEYVDRKDVYLICDVRSLEYDKDKATPAAQQANEDLVWADMLRQQEWVKLIKPVKASLKFRLPYAYEFELKRGPTRSYLDGLVYRQAWAPLSSTETRLVPNDDLTAREWDIKVYEEMLFHHNAVTRETVRYLNPLTNDRTPIATKLGLLNDFDSTLTATIVMEYLTKFNHAPTSTNVVAVLDALITAASRNGTTLVGLRVGGGDDDVD